MVDSSGAQSWKFQQPLHPLVGFGLGSCLDAVNGIDEGINVFRKDINIFRTDGGFVDKLDKVV